MINIPPCEFCNQNTTTKSYQNHSYCAECYEFQKNSIPLKWSRLKQHFHHVAASKTHFFLLIDQILNEITLYKKIRDHQSIILPTEPKGDNLNLILEDYQQEFFDQIHQRIAQLKIQIPEQIKMEKLISIFERLKKEIDGFETFSDNAYYELKIILRKLIYESFYDSNSIREKAMGILESFNQALNNYQFGSGLFFLEFFLSIFDFYYSTAPLQVEQKYTEFTQYFIKVFRNRNKLFKYLVEPQLLIPLWSHQEEALNAWKQNNKIGLVEMATATGKTFLGLKAIEICSRIAQSKSQSEYTHWKYQIYIVCHSLAILNQWKQTILENLQLAKDFTDDDSISFKIGHKHNSYEFRIEFLTFQKLIRESFYIHNKRRCTLLIVDEVHHASGPEFRKAIDFDAQYKLGLSATIDGTQRNQVLNRYFNKVVYTYTLQDAIRDNIIPEFDMMIKKIDLSLAEEREYREITSKIRNLFISVNNSPSRVEDIAKRDPRFYNLLRHKNFELQNLGDFIKLTEIARFNKIMIPEKWKTLTLLLFNRRQIIHNSIPKIEDAAEVISNYAKTQKCVAFTMNIDSCETLFTLLKSTIPHTYTIHSRNTNEENENALCEFRKIKHGILIAAKMLDEGIDIPDADIGINVASTKSKLQLIQRIGRVLRKGDNPTKHPLFIHYVSTIPNRFEPEDDFALMNETSWIYDIATQYNLSITEMDGELQEMLENHSHFNYNLKAIQQMIREGTDINLGNFGTFNLRNVIRSIPDNLKTKIRKELDRYRENRLNISDLDWLTIIQNSINDVGLQGIKIPGHWWIVNVCNHQIDLIKQIFTY